MTVLIAEDEDDLRDSVLEICELLGAKAVGAPNGKIALELALTQNFDFILTDIRMPEMSGFEFIKKLKEKKPDSKFAFMSGFSDYKNTELLAMGAKAVLAKPFTREDLESILK